MCVLCGYLRAIFSRTDSIFGAYSVSFIINEALASSIFALSYPWTSSKSHIYLPPPPSLPPPSVSQEELEYFQHCILIHKCPFSHSRSGSEPAQHKQECYYLTTRARRRVICASCISDNEFTAIGVRGERSKRSCFFTVVQ